MNAPRWVSWYPSAKHPWRSLVAVIVVAFVAVGNTVLLSLATGLASPTRAFWIDNAQRFANAVLVVALAFAVIPPVAARTVRMRSLFRWPLLWVLFVAIAVCGTAVTSAWLHGLLGVGDSVAGLFRIRIGAALFGVLVGGTLLAAIDIQMWKLHFTERELQQTAVERSHAKRLAAEAQLASLTSRVQPHFLFNTLNSIAGLIREDPELAERTVERLSALLRHSLETSYVVPLSRELGLVDDYLEIQKIRWGSRLRYETRWTEDEIDGMTIPVFSLQTLVENAVKHVATNRLDGVSLGLNVRRADDHLFIDVTDDGPGFARDAIRTGHGLDTLEARLHALYGPRAALELDRHDDGMTVRVRLPCH